MLRVLLISTLLFGFLFGKAQIDIDYALDDNHLSEKRNVLSLSMDDLLRGSVGLYYTREFSYMDISIGASRQSFKAFGPDFSVLDMYSDVSISNTSNTYKYSLVYDQLKQNVESFGFSMRLHYLTFSDTQYNLDYTSIAFSSGVIYKPIFNHSYYLNAFVGLAGVLYQDNLDVTGLNAYLAVELRVGYKFKI